MAWSLKAACLRVAFRAISRVLWRHAPQDLRVDTRTIAPAGATFRVRSYTPPAAAGKPLLLYFHGGGFVIGDIEAYDGTCRDLAHRLGWTVLSVDYRLAPEHPFPAAAEDALAALQWLQAHAAEFGGDGRCVFVAGDSAGGNLAAVTALQAREHCPGLLAGQVLVYPVTDHYSANRPSYAEHAHAKNLGRAMMVWFWDTYLRHSPLLAAGAVRHPLATPLCADSLAGLPPALVLTAEQDPLRDEGEAYAARLRAAGVAVQLTRYEGLGHGFFGSLGPGPAHQRALTEISDWLHATAATHAPGAT